MTKTRNNITISNEVKNMLCCVKAELKKNNGHTTPTFEDAIKEMFVSWQAINEASKKHINDDVYISFITTRTSLKKLELAERLGLLK